MRRDGRWVEPTRVPAEVYRALVREAERRGQRVGRVAGDLIAVQLPRAYAEAAARRLAPAFLAKGAPEIAPRGARNSSPAPAGSLVNSSPTRVVAGASSEATDGEAES